MASLSFDARAEGYRLSFRDGDKRKRSICLSGVDESNGLEWKRHVEHLLEQDELDRNFGSRRNGLVCDAEG